MYPVWVAPFIGLILAAWLGVLSFIFWRERELSHRLFPKEGAGDIKDKLRELLEVLEKLKRNERELILEIDQSRKEGLGHLSKIEVLRYNPYQDTGGDQSFSIVLLDGNLNGVILTSLHSRAGTRVYAKNIIGGKSDLELSREEREVLRRLVS